ncbi:SMI1/KNR4 family protein [Catellatospora coxensis]
MATVAARLGLPAADDLAVDPLIYHGSRVRLRAGHWAVTVAAAQEDTDLPILLEVDVTYGADLPGRLAQLAPPPSAGTPVDWDAVSSRLGVALPADYRWLAERYGGGMVGGRISVLPPDELSPPLLGPLKGPLRYMTARTLPIATTADGALVSWVLDPEDQPGQWGLRSCATGHPDEELEIGLLHYLVVTLSGAYRAWGGVSTRRTDRARFTTGSGLVPRVPAGEVRERFRLGVAVRPLGQHLAEHAVEAAAVTALEVLVQPGPAAVVTPSLVTRVVVVLQRQPERLGDRLAQHEARLAPVDPHGQLGARRGVRVECVNPRHEPADLTQDVRRLITLHAPDRTTSTTMTRRGPDLEGLWSPWRPQPF